MGDEETSVFLATKWDENDIDARPDVERIPKEFLELTIEPGETYVMNNVATYETLVPHSTKKSLGRIMLCQHIHTRFALVGDIARAYEERGGLTVILQKPSQPLGCSG